MQFLNLEEKKRYAYYLYLWGKSAAGSIERGSVPPLLHGPVIRTEIKKPIFYPDICTNVRIYMHRRAGNRSVSALTPGSASQRTCACIFDAFSDGAWIRGESREKCAAGGGIFVGEKFGGLSEALISVSFPARLCNEVSVANKCTRGLSPVCGYISMHT